MVVDPDAHRIAALSADEYAGYARKLREPIDDLGLGDPRELDLVEARAGQRDPHDRVGVGVPLGNDGLFDLVGKLVADARHAVTHVVRSRLEIMIEHKLHIDPRNLLAADRGHFLHPRQTVELVFENVGHRRLDHLGRRTREYGGDGDQGRIDRRQLAVLEPRSAEDAEERDHQRHHRGENRPVDADLGDPHVPSPVVAGPSA
jgi:hypothetical protein